MTQKPTFTLTITNGNQGRMAAADAARPKAENANRPEDRLMARAKLAATYAGLLGVTTAPRDIFDIVATAPCRAMIRRQRPKHWPAGWKAQGW